MSKKWEKSLAPQTKIVPHGLTGNESSRQRMFLGANTLECESSRERTGQSPIGRFAPGSELARERKSCESVECTDCVIMPNSVITHTY